MRTTRRGDAFGKTFGHAGCGEQQRDGQREQPDAGGDGGQPERDRQEQRHREEQARLQEVLEEEGDQAAAQQPVVRASPGRAARA